MRLERLKPMDNTNQYIKPCRTLNSQKVNFVFLSDPMALRGALDQVMNFLHNCGFGKKQRGMVELVLAEVLNNVIEHAYQERGDGAIELTVIQKGDALEFIIEDEGLPMPNGLIPLGKKPDLSVSREGLPEGGFGWFLIRELTENLNYTRLGKQSQLTFLMVLGKCA